MRFEHIDRPLPVHPVKRRSASCHQDGALAKLTQSGSRATSACTTNALVARELLSCPAAA